MTARRPKRAGRVGPMRMPAALTLPGPAIIVRFMVEEHDDVAIEIFSQSGKSAVVIDRKEQARVRRFLDAVAATKTGDRK